MLAFDEIFQNLMKARAILQSNMYLTRQEKEEGGMDDI